MRHQYQELHLLIFVIKLIKPETDKPVIKTLIYTNWIDKGVNVIEKALKRAKISFRLFTGGLNKEEKNDLVNSFNNDEFSVLVITRSGAEGLDLKRVRQVIIMDPVWNQAILNQIIGRAARYKSHEGLSEEKRHVNVYKLVL